MMGAPGVGDAAAPRGRGRGGRGRGRGRGFNNGGGYGQGGKNSSAVANMLWMIDSVPISIINVSSPLRWIWNVWLREQRQLWIQ